MALQSAHNLVNAGSQLSQPAKFCDGIYFAPLAALDASDYVLSAIAGAVGFKFQEGPNPKQQLLDHLRDKQMLLILDNFEHLLDATDLVIEILQAAPHVTILVTSRERLALHAETIYTLGGMDIPDTETQDSALQSDAAQLFVRSVLRVRRDFAPDKQEIEQINRICHLTNGMPLAIILATAWLDTLSLQELAGEIENNLDILQTEMRDIPQRLHSVRAVFETVWGRLSASEQAAFLRISVFRGGCTRAAAELVAGARPRELQGLMNKALLTADGIGSL